MSIEMLIENYTEEELQFVGIVSGIPSNFDPTSRSNVLSAIDKGKRTKQIVNNVSRNHNALLYLDAFNIKLSALDAQEEVFLRVPIYEVAAASYLWADKQHVLAIQFGGADTYIWSDTVDSRSCHLAVLYCDSQVTAEQLCSAIEQSFQRAYAEATIRFFDNAVPRDGQSAIDVSASPFNRTDLNTEDVDCISPILTDRTIPATSSSLSTSNAHSTTTLSSSTVSRSLSRTTIQSESELSSSANDLIFDYMTKLQTKLNKSELQRFAQLVQSWQTDMSISSFCPAVLELYGLGRRHLLIDMKPFIPDKDKAYFERFLETHVQTNDFDEHDFEIVSRPQLRQSVREDRVRRQERSPWQTVSVDQDLDSFDDLVDDVAGGIEQLGSNERTNMNSNDNNEQNGASADYARNSSYKL